tara:strand:- start:41232 stop:44621 length:3390 start_codon:yes stop_codon:yes gene_type:complete
MSKSIRVRTQVGKDQKVNIELTQDFDLLEILSLSLSQDEVYTRMCADFGVVVGRVISNGGYGIPNAKVSIFIPIDYKDEQNPVVMELYPYKQIFDKNEDGKRYNLLSQKQNFDCHVPVGTFPNLTDVLEKQDVEYVYDKYYKFTSKTNEAGDFMLYGVPIGEQQLVMDVDLSDIGCFSMLPEDFRRLGFSDDLFDGSRFKDDAAIDSLPQIIGQQKAVDVRPFWGDEEFCSAAITRVDFDLANSGVKIQPTSVFMGSTATDTDKDSVNKRCRPRRHMGELCSLITQPGIIDCIRYTPFLKEDPECFPDYPYNFATPTGGGQVPVLERYYFENGGRVIDETGTFLIHIPMNLDHMITDEFGNLVKSNDPTQGVATRSRCRFRVRPEQASGTARQRRRAAHLVPQIREFGPASDIQGDWPNIGETLRDGSGALRWYDPYCFSIEYSDYHPWAQGNLMPGAKDIFYDMTFNRVYTYSQFHDHIKHNGRRQFIGIKEILPEQDQQCSTSAMFFPINSAVRRNKGIIALNNFILLLTYTIYWTLSWTFGLIASILGIIMIPILAIMLIICVIMTAINSWTWFAGLINVGPVPSICSQFSWVNQCAPECLLFGIPMGFTLFTLRQTKYPECEKCSCRTNANSDMTVLTPNYGWANDDCGGNSTNIFGAERDVVCCPDTYGYDSTTTNPTPTVANSPTNPANDLAAGGGCYVKVMCINVACFGLNTNDVLIREWYRREKIASALCNGVMNYFWENAWVNGFLYQFQFRAKLVYNYTNDTYATNATRYCKKILHLHPNDHAFYYRCTPFRYSSADTGKFIGDDDGAKGGSSSTNEHSQGDMERHLLFPTTIIDMGSRNQCIQQICLDEKFAEECSTTDQIGSTTFQDITDLVSDAYNLKAAEPFLTVGGLFARPESEIGGDMAQALMQNCMLGVFGYETNAGSLNCDCNIPPTAIPPTTEDIEYPPTNDINNSGSYVANAINVNAGYDIQWEPLLFTAGTPTIMTGADLMDCVSYELSGSSQIIPFYIWRIDGSSGFGNENNDWQYTLGTYQSQNDNWTAGATIINSGDYQNNVGLLNSFPQPNTSGDAYPPISSDTGPSMLFSQPLFFYFGLRPGETAYNKFIRIYVDEELSDTVI